MEIPSINCKLVKGCWCQTQGVASSTKKWKTVRYRSSSTKNSKRTTTSMNAAKFVEIARAGDITESSLARDARAFSRFAHNFRLSTNRRFQRSIRKKLNYTCRWNADCPVTKLQRNRCQEWFSYQSDNLEICQKRTYPRLADSSNAYLLACEQIPSKTSAARFARSSQTWRAPCLWVFRKTVQARWTSPVLEIQSRSSPLPTLAQVSRAITQRTRRVEARPTKVLCSSIGLHSQISGEYDRDKGAPCCVSLS